MIARAILPHHDVTSRLGQHVEQQGPLALGVQPPLLPFVEKPSRASVEAAKPLVAFALAAGGHGGGRAWGIYMKLSIDSLHQYDGFILFCQTFSEDLSRGVSFS